tara:strand:- start:3449 stop:3664 length:216 start_codon:yes stop_codon:yes gene_type:complete
MKNKIKIGDLVHVPSSVTLYNETTTYKLHEPANLLITGKNNNNYEVFFNGSSWYVSHSSVYEIGEKNAKVY